MRLRIPDSARGLLLVGTLWLGGCSNLQLGDDIQSVYKYSQMAFTPHRVTLAEAAAIPYASMGVSIGGGDQAIIVLATANDGAELWTSATHIALSTRKGRIVRAAGLGRGLSSFSMVSTSWPSRGVVKTQWELDLQDINVYGARLFCESKSVGEEDIEILGKRLRTVRSVEECATQGDGFKWNFQNTYWSSPESGFVWRSIQHVHPELEAVQTEIFRKPG